MRLDYESTGHGSSDDTDDDLRLYFRTLRPILDGRFLQDRLSLRLQLNVVPGSPELMDLYFDWKARPSVVIRFGQFKVPFTRYRVQSRNRLTFVDWSLVSPFFGAERQIGLAVHNGYEQPGGFEYAVGLFSGTNARASHGVVLPILYGLPRDNLSDLAGDGGEHDIHPELFARLAVNNDGIALQSDTDPTGGPFRASVGFSAAYDFDADVSRDLVWRLAPELLVKYEGCSATLIGYVAGARIGPDLEVEPALTGLLVQSAWRLSNRWEVSGRVARIGLTDKMVDHARQRRWEEEPSSPAIPELEVAVRQYSLGVNCYLVEHQVKLQATVDWQLYHTDRHDVLLQTQFQLSF
jgi:hypothetical protein